MNTIYIRCYTREEWNELQLYLFSKEYFWQSISHVEFDISKPTMHLHHIDVTPLRLFRTSQTDDSIYFKDYMRNEYINSDLYKVRQIIYAED